MPSTMKRGWERQLVQLLFEISKDSAPVAELKQVTATNISVNKSFAVQMGQCLHNVLNHDGRYMDILQ